MATTIKKALFRLVRPVLLSALAIAAGAGAAAAGSFSTDGGKDPCAIEENGISGTLTVDFMIFRGGQSQNLPTLIMVVADSEFAQLAERLLCRKEAAGYVLINEIDWEAHLRLTINGDRMIGRLTRNNQRVHVITRKDAGKYY